MTSIQRFDKPNVYSMPADIGIRVMKHILDTPRYDRRKAEAEADRLEKEMIRVIEEEKRAKK